MQIPKEVIYDRAELRRLRSQLRKVHSESYREREQAQAARNRIRDLCCSVGVGEFPTANKIDDVGVLHRILDMKEKGLEDGCPITFQGCPGKVLGMTGNGYVQIFVERRGNQKVNVLPVHIERRSDNDPAQLLEANAVSDGSGE